MNQPAVGIELADPRNNGIHLLQREALDSLPAMIGKSDMTVTRIALAGCSDKQAILAAFADALAFPPTFGHNWDALADCLADLGWLPQGGTCLFLDGINWTRPALSAELATLMEILGETVTRASHRGEPWHVFLPIVSTPCGAQERST